MLTVSEPSAGGRSICPSAGPRVRDATYAAAGDARAAAHAEAEQRHYERLAAIQRHFGQQVMSRGDPDADHALAFVETVADPAGLYSPQPAEAASNGVRGIGRVVEIRLQRDQAPGSPRRSRPDRPREPRCG